MSAIRKLLTIAVITTGLFVAAYGTGFFAMRIAFADHHGDHAAEAGDGHKKHHDDPSTRFNFLGSPGEHYGKDATGGHIAAPIFGSFMKQALADKPATPFRIPPGIKLVRVNPSTGLRTQPGDTRSVLEAFKPDEEPDDPYSIIGFTDETGGFVQPPDQEGGQGGGWAPRTERSGGRGEDARAITTRRGLW